MNDTLFQRGCWLVLIVSLMCVGSYAQAAFIDLSTLTNLDDNIDDTAQVVSAIAAAGEGGGIYIPHGEAIVSQPVSINYDRFTLLGSDPDASAIVFKTGGRMMVTASGEAGYRIRNLGISVSSGSVSSLISFSALMGGEVNLLNVSFAAEGGNWGAALHCTDIDTVTLCDVEIRGTGAADQTGIRLSGQGRSAFLNTLQLEDLQGGVVFTDGFDYMHLGRLDMRDVNEAVVVRSSPEGAKLLIYESTFDGGVRSVQLLSPCTFGISNCRFFHSRGAVTDPELYLNSPGVLSGTITGCDFDRGIRCDNVDNVTISGNVFRNGFKNENTSTEYSHVVVDFKTTVQFEGNDFITEHPRNIEDLRPGNGSVQVDQHVGFTVQLRPIAHYPMDGDVSEADGSGFDGTLAGGAFADSLVGHDQGLVLDGTDDYVEIPRLLGVTGSTAHTCAAWIKTSDDTWYKDIVGWGNAAPGERWLVSIVPEGMVRVAVIDGYQESTIRVNDGLWHHIAVVLEDDGSSETDAVRIYIDGVEETNYTTLTKQINTVPSQNVQIGLFSDASNRYFQGQIDDVRIYSSALTPEEIQTLAAISRPPVDIVLNDMIDLADISALAAYWLQSDCFSNDLCDGRDLNADQTVNLEDLSILSTLWLSSLTR